MQWARVIDHIISLKPEIVVPQHSQPIYGQEKIRDTLIKYRDAIQYVHDQTLRRANKGKALIIHVD